MRMRFASVVELKNQLSAYLAQARKRGEPIVVTRHGKPFALIRPLEAEDLEEFDWTKLAEKRLRDSWKSEADVFYY